MPAVALTLRLHSADLAALDALVAELAGSPVAVAAGGRWGRPAVLRLAVDAGLKALRGGAPLPATLDPFNPPDAPADDLAGPVVRLAVAPPVTLPARPAATAGELASLCALLPADAPVLVRQGEGWFDFGQGEVREGRPVNEGDPDDPGCEVGWDVRPAGRRAPRGRWCRVLTFE